MHTKTGLGPVTAGDIETGGLAEIITPTGYRPPSMTPKLN